MKKLLFINILLLLPIYLWGDSYCNYADVVESITTKNNNLYFGFIQTQVMGKEVEFQTYATIFEKSITPDTKIHSTFISKDKLSEKWRWIVEDHRFDVEYCVEDGNTGLMLCSFTTEGVTIENVVVLNTGNNFVRYIDNNDRKDYIKLSDILCVEKNLEQQEKSGLIDVIQFNDSRDDIKGYITKQTIGKNISVKDYVTGIISEVNLKDIKAIKKECKDNNALLIESSRWIEVIETESGRTLEGFITKKIYDSNGQDGIMSVLTPDKGSDLDFVKMREVVSIKRRINTRYIDFYYTTTSNTIITVNDQTVSEVPINSKSKEYFTINNISGSIVDVPKNNYNVNASIVIKRPMNENITDIVAYAISDIHEENFYYKDILNKSIQSKQYIKGKTVIDTFTLPTGVYLLYVKDANVVYIIRI